MVFSRGARKYRTWTRRACVAVSATLLGTLGAYIPATQSAAATAPVLLQGKVTAKVGTALSGVPVAVYAWPDIDPAGLADGTRVDLTLIARTSTTATGAYTVAVAPTSLPAALLADGDLDLQVYVGSGTQTVMYDESITKATTGWSTPALTTAESTAAPTVDFALGAGTATVSSLSDPTGTGTLSLNTSLGTLSTSTLSPAGVTTTTALPDLAPPIPCVYWWQAKSKIPGINQAVIDAFSWSGAKATVTEDVGASGTLGIGVKVETPAGPKWSAGGTKKIKAAASDSVGNLVNRRLYNKVTYQDFRLWCGAIATTKYERRPLAVQTILDHHAAVPAVNWHNSTPGACQFYTRQTPFRTPTKSKGTNYTFSTGVDLVAISVSTDMDFSADLKIMWTIQQATYLCGSNRLLGWVSSPRAEAH